MCACGYVGIVGIVCVCVCSNVSVYDHRKRTVEKKEEIVRARSTQEVKAEKKATWGDGETRKQKAVEEKDEYKV